MPLTGEGSLQVAVAAAVLGTLVADVSAARATTAAGLTTLNARFTRAQIAFNTLMAGGTPDTGDVEDAMVALHTDGGHDAAQAFLTQMNIWMINVNANSVSINTNLGAIVTYATA